MGSEESLEQVARNINTLASFLGMRDVPARSRDALVARYGFEQADVMALFGGSILAGGGRAGRRDACRSRAHVRNRGRRWAHHGDVQGEGA